MLKLPQLVSKFRSVCRIKSFDRMKCLKLEAHICIAEKWYFHQFMLQENNYVKLSKLWNKF